MWQFIDAKLRQRCELDKSNLDETKTILVSPTLLPHWNHQSVAANTQCVSETKTIPVSPTLRPHWKTQSVAANTQCASAPTASGQGFKDHDKNRETQSPQSIRVFVQSMNLEVFPPEDSVDGADAGESKLMIIAWSVVRS